ncbi:hypothetical protein N1851_029700 [Merluccius polli]|uniref:Uncharacterized protein n=1 Tax=Merluccius polli TaxID=89951 RepID=A0AA47NQL5_MERPO|nr:hypothetical protein N1851_029700 [Merluccius polli]
MELKAIQKDLKGKIREAREQHSLRLLEELIGDSPSTAQLKEGFLDINNGLNTSLISSDPGQLLLNGLVNRNSSKRISAAKLDGEASLQEVGMHFRVAYRVLDHCDIVADLNVETSPAAHGLSFWGRHSSKQPDKVLCLCILDLCGSVSIYTCGVWWPHSLSRIVGR